MEDLFGGKVLVLFGVSWGLEVWLIHRKKKREIFGFFIFRGCYASGWSD